MGLFSFMFDKGKDVDKESDGTPKKEALEKQVADLGVDVKGLDVKVEGKKVKVGGKASDQAAREKAILALGNVAGVEQVEDDITVDNPGPESKTYEVKSGDTLWKIAERELGDGSKYNQIFEANRPMLKDPDQIYPGQVLRIPA